MTSPDNRNERFEMATELVNGSSRSIFLTGKAGTGKTTFLRYIRETTPKQHVVVAPTGVAAMNAGGVTIHSFFQLPFVPFLPGHFHSPGESGQWVDEHGLISRLRFNKEKIQLLNELELLIIDEVSMVRCDVLDSVDTVLRHVRHRMQEPFGGVQVLMIGDMFQLPPVTREDVWDLLRPHYAGPYFFDSQVLTNHKPLFIEFDKIYRQTDDKFIHVLNQVRHNTLDESGMETLEERYQPSFFPHDTDGYIMLTTHNDSARAINHAQLERLPGKIWQYDASIEDDFPENGFPADEVLRLKEGAQVMFIRNDLDRSKRFFNGKLGEIISLEKEKMEVRCRGEKNSITVTREKWENIRYAIDKKTREIGQQVLGSFSQFPVRLAWAITIHKSQGLTFDKAIIDAGKAFAPGQVYVALSRCTSLDGLILKSRITASSLSMDPRILAFSDSVTGSAELKSALDIARKAYKESLLVRTFQFQEIITDIQTLAKYVIEHHQSFNDELPAWCETLAVRLTALQETAARFHSWISEQFLVADEQVGLSALQDRIPRAVAHFSKELAGILAWMGQCPAVTDNKLHAKEFNERCRDVFTGVSLQKFMIDGLQAVPDPVTWHERRNAFRVPLFTINAYGGAGTQQPSAQSPHPELHQRLRRLRKELCDSLDLPVYMVAGSKSIDEMVEYLPMNEDELERITGFGEARVARFGNRFLDIIREYGQEQGLTSRIHEKEVKAKRPKKEKVAKEKPVKVDTQLQSFQLFREGKDIKTIAGIRNLAASTIERHLSFYIANGEIDAGELVPEAYRQAILDAQRRTGFTGLTALKEILDPSITYTQIRFVLLGAGIYQLPAAPVRTDTPPSDNE